MSKRLPSARGGARADRDCGNLMLSLILVMVTAMLLSLVLATVLQQVSKTKNDRAFTSALPAADAGVQQALAYLNAGQALPTAASPATMTTTQATGSVTNSWYAAAVDGTGPGTAQPVAYTVTSATTVNNVTRTITAKLTQTQRFLFSLFADQDVVFRGGNKATSYPAPGSGQVGTNATVTINGNGSSSADTCTLYNSTANGSTGRVSGPCTSVNYQPAKQDITSAATTQFITDGVNSCQGGPVPYTPQILQAGRTYCFTSVSFDGTESVLGTSASPTKIFVSGNVSVPNHTFVHASTSSPDSGGLQIYSLGSAFTMGNNSKIGAAVWAPKAVCGGGAQAVVYGSLVCGSISNVGGWTFDFDTNLRSVGDGQWKMSNYGES